MIINDALSSPLSLSYHSDSTTVVLLKYFLMSAMQITSLPFPSIMLNSNTSRSNKSLQKYFTAFDQALLGMEVIESYGSKFDKTKHGSLFLSKVGGQVFRPLDYA